MSAVGSENMNEFTHDTHEECRIQRTIYEDVLSRLWHSAPRQRFLTCCIRCPTLSPPIQADPLTPSSRSTSPSSGTLIPCSSNRAILPQLWRTAVARTLSDMFLNARRQDEFCDAVAPRVQPELGEARKRWN